MLDATGLVVAPGFIDLHAHGQDLPAARMQAFDGVTTALELESGTLPVAAAYDRVGREGRPINYGFSASWLFARIAEKEAMEPTGAVTFFQDAQRRKGWQHTLASPEETARIVARVEQGLQEGELGIGVLAGYAPATDARRLLRWRSSRRARSADIHACPLHQRDRAAVLVRGDRGDRVPRRRDGRAHAHPPFE